MKEEAKHSKEECMKILKHKHDLLRLEIKHLNERIEILEEMEKENER